MPVNRNLVKTVVTIVGTAGPVVATYLKDHPEIVASVNATVTKLVRRRTASPADMRSTITVLREQVQYLSASADDDAEQRRAAEWSRRLDNLDHAATMLLDGGSRAEIKTLRAQVTALRGEILAAFIAEQAQDADGQLPQIEG